MWGARRGGEVQNREESFIAAVTMLDAQAGNPAYRHSTASEWPTLRHEHSHIGAVHTGEWEGNGRVVLAGSVGALYTILPLYDGSVVQRIRCGSIPSLCPSPFALHPLSCPLAPRPLPLSRPLALHPFYRTTATV